MKQVYSVLAYCLPFLVLASQPALIAGPFAPGDPLPNIPTSPSWLQGAGLVSHLTSGQLNAGNVEDIIVLSSSEDRVMWLDVSSSSPSPSPVLHLVSDSLRGPAAACAMDIDNDGDMDLIVSSRWNQSLVSYTNDGAGNFANATTIATDIDTAVELHLADINGDNRKDLVGISDFTREVFWLKRNSNGSFSAKQILISTLGTPIHLECKDFDANGSQDLAVLNSSAGTITVYLNNGSGSMTEHANIGVGLSSFTAAIFVAGKTDIVGVSSTTGIAKLFANNGSATFASPQILSDALLGSDIVASTDLNKDGETDILLGNYLSGLHLWLEHYGTRVFSGPQLAASSSTGSNQYALIDKDADDAPELVRASRHRDELSLHQGLAANPYAFWLSDYGLDASAHPVGGDANSNGIFNLQAYAFNFSPATPIIPQLVPGSGGGGLPVPIANDPSGSFAIEFIRRKNPLFFGLTYSLHISENLSDWNQVSLGGATITSINPRWERVRYVVPSPQGNHGFFKVQINYVTP